MGKSPAQKRAEAAIRAAGGRRTIGLKVPRATFSGKKAVEEKRKEDGKK